VSLTPTLSCLLFSRHPPGQHRWTDNQRPQHHPAARTHASTQWSRVELSGGGTRSPPRPRCPTSFRRLAC